MKGKNLIIAAITLGVIGSAYYFSSGRDGPTDGAALTDIPAESTTSYPGMAESDSYSSDELSDGTRAPVTTGGGLVSRSSLSSANEGDVIASWGDTVRFHIVATNCRQQSDGSGWGCAPKTVADHPFESFTNEQLEQIADADGAAALILAYRLSEIDFEQAKPVARRAFLLTGDATAFHLYLNVANVSAGMSESPTKEQVEMATRAYVWHAAGEKLGLDTSWSAKNVREKLVEQGYGDYVADADLHIDGLVARIRNERIALVGEDFE